MAFTKVMTTVTANSNSTVYKFNGGEGQIVVSGTFDTAEVTLQMSPDAGTTWVAVGDASTFTVAGDAGFSVHPCQLRINVASVGSSTSVSGWLSAEVADDLYT